MQQRGFRLEPVEVLKYLLDSCSVTDSVCRARRVRSCSSRGRRPAPVTNTVPELQKTGDENFCMFNVSRSPSDPHTSLLKPPCVTFN